MSLRCQLCSSTHKKFVCEGCVRDKLQANQVAIEAVLKERETLAEGIKLHLQDRTATGIRMDDEASSKEAYLKELEQAIASLRSSNQQKRQQIQQVRAEIETRRTALDKAVSNLKHNEPIHLTSVTNDIHDAWHSYKTCTDTLVHSRRLLVRELVSVFRLRRVQRTGSTPSSQSVTRHSPSNHGSGIELGNSTVGTSRSTVRTNANASNQGNPAEGNTAASGGRRLSVVSSRNLELAEKLFYDDPQEYRIINVGFSTYGDYFAYQREKFNAGLGHVVHMTIIMSHYLGVTLPFPVTYKGSLSSAQCGIQNISPLLDNNPSPPSQVPLFLTDSNLDAFTVGLSMLNYDIAYLCHSQGVTIPIHQVPNTLENLALCCRAANLGCDVNKLPEPSSLAIPTPSSTPPKASSSKSLPSALSISPSTANPTDSAVTSREPFYMDFNKVTRLHVALRRRQRPMKGRQGSRNGIISDVATDDLGLNAPSSVGDPGFCLLAAVLDEESGDEEEGGVDAGWHLV
ncbi:hypothetical protein HDU76_002547 [Blyttiomyces sp. JEL0837]|nr:hypothetical protein HDU76_002547 [Blyttiomyces sp. JEL0837]